MEGNQQLELANIQPQITGRAYENLNAPGNAGDVNAAGHTRNINSLPHEVLTMILLLSASPTKEKPYPYITLSGICPLWRLLIINNSRFWTLIQDGPLLRVKEVIERSKSAPLDLMIRDDSVLLLFQIENLFAGHRPLRTLQLLWHEKLPGIIQPFLSKLDFSVLEGLVLGGFSLPCDPFFHLLPIIVASNNCLEVLQITLRTDIPLAPLENIIARLTTFSIKLLSPVPPSLLDSLLSHGVNLQNLWLDITIGQLVSNHSHLPSLHFLSLSRSSLLRYFQTSALSSLYVTWKSNLAIVSLDYRALKEFNFSTISHLYIIPNDNPASPIKYSILGSKHCLHPHDRFSSGPSYPEKDYIRIQDLDIFGLSDFDIVFGTFPHDTFWFNFENDNIFSGPLKQALTLNWLLPRLTSLTFLYASFPHLTPPHFGVEEILSQTPFITKLIFKHPEKTLDVIRALRDISLAPQLNYLAYTTLSASNSAEKKESKKLLAKALTKCVKSRGTLTQTTLTFIALRGQSLSSGAVNKLKKFGADVVTKADVSAEA